MFGLKFFRYLTIFVLATIGMEAQTSANSFGDDKKAGKYYELNGIKMYCEIYGNGEPLLMIHGNGGSIKSFENNINFFAKKYKVIVADSRAQGRSIDKNDSLNFKMLADDEVELLNVLKIDSAYVLGWSDGGIIALEMAIHHPEKVKKIASTGANLFDDETAIVEPDWINEKAYFEKNKCKIWKSEEEKTAWKLFLLDYLHNDISFSQLNQIKIPSLIICCDRDIIKLSHTEKIFKNIPNSYLWVVPNSSHGTLIDQKDEFNQKVDDFFSKK